MKPSNCLAVPWRFYQFAPPTRFDFPKFGLPEQVNNRKNNQPDRVYKVPVVGNRLQHDESFRPFEKADKTQPGQDCQGDDARKDVQAMKTGQGKESRAESV